MLPPTRGILPRNTGLPKSPRGLKFILYGAPDLKFWWRGRCCMDWSSGKPVGDCMSAARALTGALTGTGVKLRRLDDIWWSNVARTSPENDFRFSLSLNSCCASPNGAPARGGLPPSAKDMFARLGFCCPL